MKTKLLLFAFFIAIGCSKKSSELSVQPTVKLNEPFQLKVGQSATLNDGFTLTFQSVADDSRCPKGVECLWEGNASVVMKFSDGMDTLNTIKPSGIVHGTHLIVMELLTPYPEFPPVTPKDPYLVTLNITYKK